MFQKIFNKLWVKAYMRLGFAIYKRMNDNIRKT